MKRVAAWMTALACMSFAAFPVTAANQTSPSAPVTGAAFEAPFLEDLADHVAAAAALDQLCAQKAPHQDLRQLCETDDGTLQAQGQQLQGWLALWYNVSFQPQLSSAAQTLLGQLRAADGAYFETLFLENMIQFDWEAVRGSQTCVERVPHAELASACEDVISTQTKNVQAMQAELCNWYGICNFPVLSADMHE